MHLYYNNKFCSKNCRKKEIKNKEYIYDDNHNEYYDGGYNEYYDGGYNEYYGNNYDGIIV